MAENVKTLTGYVVGVIVLAFALFASAEQIADGGTNDDFESGSFFKIFNPLLHKAKMHYQHFWPDFEFGWRVIGFLEFEWRVIVGSVVGFSAVAFGSVGDVGGDGVFVPMLTLIIGFDPKTSTAISICMIAGAAGATVLLRHIKLDEAIIDYDLVLLLQPMLLLGISIGVVLNILFAEWMVTVLLIILILVTSTRSFFKGIEAWKKETRIEEVVFRRLACTTEYWKINTNNTELYEEEHENEDATVLYKLLAERPMVRSEAYTLSEVSIDDNVYWKDLTKLIAVWFILLILHIFKTYTSTCSTAYWILNVLQVPVAVGASAYQAVCLYKGTRVVMSSGEAVITWNVHQLILYCCCGILAGIVGGLLGLDGGFILGPLFLQLGISPQVSSTTATFMMIFSSSMSVIQYYLLGRFPVPYALYFVAVATVAALSGRHVVRKTISIVKRTSVIIFVLAFTIFVSALSLGGVGIAYAIKRIKEGDYMGFDNICSYKP